MLCIITTSVQAKCQTLGLLLSFIDQQTNFSIVFQAKSMFAPRSYRVVLCCCSFYESCLKMMTTFNKLKYLFGRTLKGSELCFILS